LAAKFNRLRAGLTGLRCAEIPGLRAAAHKRPSTGRFDESWVGERYATAPMTPPIWQR